MSGKGKNDKSVAEIVEVSKKIPCCKPLAEQIEIMEAYTDAFIKYSGQSAARREIEELLEERIHLFLFVKVRENWGDDPARYADWGLNFNA